VYSIVGPVVSSPSAQTMTRDPSTADAEVLSRLGDIVTGTPTMGPTVTVKGAGAAGRAAPASGHAMPTRTASIAQRIMAATVSWREPREVPTKRISRYGFRLAV
jgi:hypothetical protein